MTIIDTLYPAPHEFANAELMELAEAMNKPSVKKYLKKLGYDGIKAVALGQPDKGESAESYLRRQAVVQGQLATIETLLMIEAPAKQA